MSREIVSIKNLKPKFRAFFSFEFQCFWGKECGIYTEKKINSIIHKDPMILRIPFLHGTNVTTTRLIVEKEMATHSSVLAWRIPGIWEPGGLPSMGSHRVGHDWSDLAAEAAGWLCSQNIWSVKWAVSSRNSIRNLKNRSLYKTKIFFFWHERHFKVCSSKLRMVNPI